MASGELPENAAHRPPCPAPRPLARWAGLIGLAALCAGLAWDGLAHGGLSRFWRAFHVNYVFFLSVSLGALFFVLLHHLTRAAWSAPLRRPAELLAGNLVFWTLPAAPLLIATVFGDAVVFPWADREYAAGDELLRAKRAFLNPGFFALRCAVYLATWGLLGRYFLNCPLRRDHSGDGAQASRMERFSAPAMLLYGLTVSFAAVDLVMSVEGQWYSSIFGIHFFAGAVSGFLGLLAVLTWVLQRSGRLGNAITAAHRHDLGKLLLAFVLFRAYIAFSQYLLIWYANLPAETIWYARRTTGLWGWVAWVLICGGFLLPSLGLLGREAKRRAGVLAFWGAWVLAMHWLETCWLIQPSYGPAGAGWPGMECLLFAGLGMIYCAGVANLAGNCAPAPIRADSTDGVVATPIERAKQPVIEELGDREHGRAQAGAADQ